MIVRTAISLVLMICAIILIFRYNMHMFQLNGYKFKEHAHWIIKNIKMQWLLVAAVLVGVLRVFVNHIAVDIVMCLLWLLIILIYNVLRGLKAKKNLVYTARVKRMIATEVIIVSAVVAVLILTKNICTLSGWAMVLTGLHLYILLLINTINRPMELMINRHYINDAKRKLRSSDKLTIIGVTGSYGKTSVKFYLEELLKTSYNVLVTPESYNTPMGIVKTIRSSLTDKHDIFVCEMGARNIGDIKEICRFVRPHHGIITSVGPQHLETFFTIDNIVKTKFELADYIPRGGKLFLNGDNEYINGNAGKYENPIFYHACVADNGYYAKDISLSQTGTNFTVVSPSGEECQFSMRLIGEHNVINVVGAIAVACEMGIPLEKLKVAVRRIQSVPHRMQMLDRGTVTIIDDAYNSNPVGSKAAVETLAMFDGLHILVTPGMVELGKKEEEFNYLFGTYAAKCCDYILLVGKKRTEVIMKGALESGFDVEKCIAFDKLEDAMAYANQIKTQQHKFILLENDLPDNY